MSDNVYVVLSTFDDDHLVEIVKAKRRNQIKIDERYDSVIIEKLGTVSALIKALKTKKSIVTQTVL